MALLAKRNFTITEPILWRSPRTLYRRAANAQFMSSKSFTRQSQNNTNLKHNRQFTQNFSKFYPPKNFSTLNHHLYPNTMSEKRKDSSNTTDTPALKKQKSENSNFQQSFLTAWTQPKGQTEPRKSSTISDEEFWKGLGLDKGLLKLEADTMDREWLKVLAPELKKDYFIQLKKYLAKEKADKKTIYPPEAQIYSWSRHTPVSSVKVVIIGQDPYHGNGQAHGLCFSVQKGVLPPPSLVNIYECLKRDYPTTFQKPPHGYLGSWAKQGVLLLNASLTVRASEPNSHAGKGWEKLTDAVINYLNQKRSGIVFMLWGSYAQKKGSRIDAKKHLVLRAVHPSPLSAHKGFMDCKHFLKANEYFKQQGKTPINWNSLVGPDAFEEVKVDDIKVTEVAKIDAAEGNEVKTDDRVTEIVKIDDVKV